MNCSGGREAVSSCCGDPLVPFDVAVAGVAAAVAGDIVAGVGTVGVVAGTCPTGRTMSMRRSLGSCKGECEGS